MTETSLPSPEILRKLLRYDPETGKLFWRERGVEFFKDECFCRSWNTKWAGKEAFKANLNGYKGGGVLGKTYKAHRVIWAMEKGYWPKYDIDHINHNTKDNRLENLRDSEKFQNMANMSRHKDSLSKYLGVCWSGKHKKWKAEISKRGNRFHLGLFGDQTSAALAYDEAAKRLHGEFANLNFPEAQP